MADVVVVGGINQDILLRVADRPGPGETVVGELVDVFEGGKGANQAVAASLLGASVALVGRVGRDPIGQRQLAALHRDGVDVTWVSVSDCSVTGMAVITVTPDGENSIVVGSGANADLSATDVEDAASQLIGAKVVVAQTEVGAPPVDAAAAVTARSRRRLIVSTAPVVTLAPFTLAAADPLVANEHEAAELLAAADVRGQLVAGSAAQAHALRTALGCASVVLTLGARGAVVSTAAGTVEVPATPVHAVDTTGAGDAFIGALAAGLATDSDLIKATRRACAAAAHAVTAVGARTAFLRTDPASAPSTLLGSPSPSSASASAPS